MKVTNGILIETYEVRLVDGKPELVKVPNKEPNVSHYCAFWRVNSSALAVNTSFAKEFSSVTDHLAYVKLRHPYMIIDGCLTYYVDGTVKFTPWKDY